VGKKESYRIMKNVEKDVSDTNAIRKRTSHKIRDVVYIV